MWYLIQGKDWLHNHWHIHLFLANFLSNKISIMLMSSTVTDSHKQQI